jgi:hypothetical protein
VSEAAPPLPKGLRRASVLALVAGALVGILAAQGMAQVLRPLDEEALARVEELAASGPKEMAAMQAAFWRSYARNLESMQSSRIAILMLLSVSGSLLFVSSLRMLRPLGVPREGVRRLLGGAALACAVLSTLDGAQTTAAAKRASAAAEKVAVEAPIDGLPPGMFGAVAMVMLVGLTVLVAGSFTTLWMYFKSERVQAQLAELEKPQT